MFPSDCQCFDKFFWAVGLLISTLAVLRLIKEVVTNFKLYVCPQFFNERDLVSKYGKWAVVTAGSDGIGKGIVLELAKKGMNIFVISNNENNIVSEIQDKYNVECRHCTVDFFQTDIYSEIRQELSSIQNDIGILVNNVGYTSKGVQCLANYNETQLRQMININIMPMLLMTEMVIKTMVKNNKGLIVNIASLASIVVVPYLTMYCSVKRFVAAYTHGLAYELEDTNIEVKCVNPFLVHTPFSSGFPGFVTFIEKFLNWTAISWKDFGASVASTFGIRGTVSFCGCLSHSILIFILPYSFVGPDICTWVTKVAIKFMLRDIKM